LQTVDVLKLAHVALFIMVAVMAVSKVYSPQYVLWLVPLAVIALIDKRDLAIFWFWQGAEVLYHLAIWQHLASVTGAKFGLPVVAYSDHHLDPYRGLNRPGRTPSCPPP
jgi:uncharacterized membrane protein